MLEMGLTGILGVTFCGFDKLIFIWKLVAINVEKTQNLTVTSGYCDAPIHQYLCVCWVIHLSTDSA